MEISLKELTYGDLNRMKTSELKRIIRLLTVELDKREENGNRTEAEGDTECNTMEKIPYKIMELGYNTYKGTGKCWIATVTKETKKIIDFIKAESVQPRDNYSGKKTFSVPLVEGKCYLFCESGSKSVDDRSYYTVENGELVSF